MNILNNTFDPSEAFTDPVAFLAQFGIEAELLPDENESLAIAA